MTIRENGDESGAGSVIQLPKDSSNGQSEVSKPVLLDENISDQVSSNGQSGLWNPLLKENISDDKGNQTAVAAFPPHRKLKSVLKSSTVKKPPTPIISKVEPSGSLFKQPVSTVTQHNLIKTPSPPKQQYLSGVKLVKTSEGKLMLVSDKYTGTGKHFKFQSSGGKQLIIKNSQVLAVKTISPHKSENTPAATLNSPPRTIFANSKSPPKTILIKRDALLHEPKILLKHNKIVTTKIPVIASIVNEQPGSTNTPLIESEIMGVESTMPTGYIRNLNDKKFTIKISNAANLAPRNNNTDNIVMDVKNPADNLDQEASLENFNGSDVASMETQDTCTVTSLHENPSAETVTLNKSLSIESELTCLKNVPVHFGDVTDVNKKTIGSSEITEDVSLKDDSNISHLTMVNNENDTLENIMNVDEKPVKSSPVIAEKPFAESLFDDVLTEEETTAPSKSNKNPTSMNTEEQNMKIAVKTEETCDDQKKSVGHGIDINLFETNANIPEPRADEIENNVTDVDEELAVQSNTTDNVQENITSIVNDTSSGVGVSENVNHNSTPESNSTVDNGKTKEDNGLSCSIDETILINAVSETFPSKQDHDMPTKISSTDAVTLAQTHNAAGDNTKEIHTDLISLVIKKPIENILSDQTEESHKCNRDEGCISPNIKEHTVISDVSETNSSNMCPTLATQTQKDETEVLHANATEQDVVTDEKDVNLLNDVSGNVLQNAESEIMSPNNKNETEVIKTNSVTETTNDDNINDATLNIIALGQLDVSETPIEANTTQGNHSLATEKLDSETLTDCKNLPDVNKETFLDHNQEHVPNIKLPNTEDKTLTQLNNINFSNTKELADKIDEDCSYLLYTNREISVKKFTESVTATDEKFVEENGTLNSVENNYATPEIPKSPDLRNSSNISFSDNAPQQINSEPIKEGTNEGSMEDSSLQASHIVKDVITPTGISSTSSKLQTSLDDSNANKQINISCSVNEVLKDSVSVEVSKEIDQRMPVENTESSESNMPGIQVFSEKNEELKESECTDIPKELHVETAIQNGNSNKPEIQTYTDLIDHAALVKICSTAIQNECAKTNSESLKNISVSVSVTISTEIGQNPSILNATEISQSTDSDCTNTSHIKNKTSQTKIRKKVTDKSTIPKKIDSKKNNKKIIRSNTNNKTIKVSPHITDHRILNKYSNTCIKTPKKSNGSLSTVVLSKDTKIPEETVGVIHKQKKCRIHNKIVCKNQLCKVNKVYKNKKMLAQNSKPKINKNIDIPNNIPDNIEKNISINKSDITNSENIGASSATEVVSKKKHKLNKYHTNVSEEILSKPNKINKNKIILENSKSKINSSCDGQNEISDDTMKKNILINNSDMNNSENIGTSSTPVVSNKNRKRNEFHTEIKDKSKISRETLPKQKKKTKTVKTKNNKANGASNAVKETLIEPSLPISESITPDEQLDLKSLLNNNFVRYQSEFKNITSTTENRSETPQNSLNENESNEDLLLNSDKTSASYLPVDNVSATKFPSPKRISNVVVHTLSAPNDFPKNCKLTKEHAKPGNRLEDGNHVNSKIDPVMEERDLTKHEFTEKNSISNIVDKAVSMCDLVTCDQNINATQNSLTGDNINPNALSNINTETVTDISASKDKPVKRPIKYVSAKVNNVFTIDKNSFSRVQKKGPFSSKKFIGGPIDLKCPTKMFKKPYKKGERGRVRKGVISASDLIFAGRILGTENKETNTIAKKISALAKSTSTEETVMKVDKDNFLKNAALVEKCVDIGDLKRKLHANIQEDSCKDFDEPEKLATNKAVQNCVSSNTEIKTNKKRKIHHRKSKASK